MVCYLFHSSSMLLHCHVSTGSTAALVSSSLRRHLDETQDTVYRRRHNARSASLLLRHNQNLDHKQNLTQTLEIAPSPTIEELAVDNDEDRSRLLELSLVTRRTPQFPGSIYAQSPSDADVTSSLPPLRTVLVPGSDDDGEREMIAKALEIRRKVTREIFKEAMVRKGRFGITYATNVTDGVGVFIDHVMIEAAALKRLPEFSESTFNLRAKTVIEDSNVVPLIRSVKLTEPLVLNSYYHATSPYFWMPIRCSMLGL